MFKKSKTITISKALSIIVLMVSTLGVHAQSIYTQPEKIKEAVEKNDKLFWEAYNQCNVAQMMSFLSEDFEFYHDKNGLTKGLDAFKKGLSEGLCANGPQLKRVAKEGTVEIFPMNNIGAIIQGDHYFYIGDRADGLAKFTHVWNFENNEWKMSRVLSYDHQPVSIKTPDAITLSPSLLSKYIGNYNGAQTGDVSIVLDGDQMKLVGSQFEFKLFAKDENTFFTKEQPVLFQFVKNDKGVIQKLIVQENGEIAEELTKTK